MTDILLCGCAGKMGAAVRGFVSEREDCRIVAGVDLAAADLGFPVYSDISQVTEPANVVVDFSHPTALTPILAYCRSHPGTAAVLCTTGYSPEQVEAVHAAYGPRTEAGGLVLSTGVEQLVKIH